MFAAGRLRRAVARDVTACHDGVRSNPLEKVLSVLGASVANTIPGFPSHGESVDDDIAWSAAHANFMSTLTPEETGDLLNYSRLLTLKSRQALFQAGDQANDVYLVAAGCIRLFQVSPTGKETILWFNFPGELFGIAEIWSRSQRQVYAVANEASRVYCLRRQDFIRFLGAHPEAALTAIGILSRRRTSKRGSPGCCCASPRYRRRPAARPAPTGASCASTCACAIRTSPT